MCNKCVKLVSQKCYKCVTNVKRGCKKCVTREGACKLLKIIKIKNCFIRGATVILQHSTHGCLNCSHWLTQV